LRFDLRPPLRFTATVGAILLLASACVVPVPIPVPGGTPPPPAPAAPAGASIAALEALTHQQVNQHRARRGLAGLGYDERIAAIARRHSEEMARGRRAFGHDGFTARSNEIRGFLAMRSMSENVAYNSHHSPVSITVGEWLGSPGHRRNIESVAHSLTGVGIARSADGTYYFTQIFITVP
jgi:uncharacterized protein YkwD